MNNRCECSDPMHTNAFVDLNGVPFLLAEYLDKRNFLQLDRSMVKSEIFIDQSDSMRAVVDINVDDIGSRSSDGKLNTTGNNTKQKRLLEMIKNRTDRCDNQFDVLRRGIIIRVNYQLENNTTGKVLRTISEDLRIADRSYFLLINPKDVSDNSIVVNFNSSIVSTINNFTHGMNRMKFRITSIQLFYEMTKRSPKVPRIKNSMVSNPSYTDGYCNCMDSYDHNYHRAMQSKHVIDINGRCNCGDYGNEGPEVVTPPTWSMFNRYYHFVDGGKDIILHREEIDDPMNEVTLIPCGTIQVNRTFIINPGHRIIFKLSIWKNDVTVVNNATPIAELLNAPVYNDGPGCGCDHNINPDYETVLRLLHETKAVNERQSRMICHLNDTIRKLEERIENMENPSEPDNKCDCDHSEILEKLDDISDEIESIKGTSGGCDCPEMIPIPLEEIESMFKNV